MNNGGGWILEVDIRKFFDTLDHAHLRTFLQRRMRDGVLKRLIGKWLKAGVMEDGSVSYPDAGSPQGGVVSPILSNVFLHYVLDAWFETEVKPRLRGRAYLIRYADDFVIGFTREDDARRVMDVLPKRFGKYALAIHPDKTRLVRFQRPSRVATGREDDGPPGPETFQLLGFTHYWARSRKGYWVVKRKTASKRLSRAVRNIAQWCRRNRHRPVCQQHHTLSQKVRGHFAYYGITANGRSLANFLDAVKRCWRKWLNRRDRQRTMDWDKFNRLLKRYPLPPVRIVHSIYAHAANP
jgi:group II intron reverse transcriptase/maturase